MRNEIAEILSDWTNVDVRETARGVAISGRYRGTLFIKHTGIAPDGPDTPDDPIAAAYWLDAFAKSRIAQSFEPALGAVEPPARYSPAAQDKSAGGSLLPADETQLEEEPEEPPAVEEPVIAPEPEEEPAPLDDAPNIFPGEMRIAGGAGTMLLEDDVARVYASVLVEIENAKRIFGGAIADPSRWQALTEKFNDYNNWPAGVPIAHDVQSGRDEFLRLQSIEQAQQRHVDALRESARTFWEANNILGLRAMAKRLHEGWPQ